MLYWKANFQIPNSGTQSAEVFILVKNKEVEFYSDQQTENLLFKKEYMIPEDANGYDYLLSLEEFANYIKL